MRTGLALLVCAGLCGQALAEAGDPHYTAAGFFDVHICNWPDRPPFVMALFSTEAFEELAEVSVHAPAGEHLGNLNLARFRQFRTRDDRDKRAFIEHFNLPGNSLDGWYRVNVTLKDGRRYEAMDYVVHSLMPFPDGIQPVADAELDGIPAELSWYPVPGATQYQVFVYDRWEGRLIHTSGLAPGTSVRLPPGLLQSGGLYGWRIHARDVNGHILLGDFNHGITSPEYRFAIR